MMNLKFQLGYIYAFMPTYSQVEKRFFTASKPMAICQSIF